MIEMIYQALLFGIFMIFGTIPALFLRNRFKMVFAILFGVLIGFAAIHDYNKGQNIIWAIAKYTFLLTMGVIFYEILFRKVVKIEDFIKRIEYLEGRLNAIINALKERELLVKTDEKVWLSKFGENFEFLKKDEYFDYYKVWGSKGEFIVKIDRETGQLAGYEKITVLLRIKTILKYGIPTLIFSYILINAFLGYKEGIKLTPTEVLSNLPWVGEKIPIEEGKNCSVPMMELLLAVSQNKTKVERINQTHLSIIYKNMTFIAEIKDTKLCIYEGERKCGCIDLSTLGRI